MQDGIGFVVKDMQISFHYPAKLGDLLEVKTQILEQKFASLTLLQNIYLTNPTTPKKIFSATITLVCMDSKTQKISKIPQWAQEIFNTLEEK